MTQAIDINSLVQTLASYGVPSTHIVQVRELAKAADCYEVLRDEKYQRHEDDLAVSDSSFNAYHGDALDKALLAQKARYNALLAASAG